MAKFLPHSQSLQALISTYSTQYDMTFPSTILSRPEAPQVQNEPIVAWHISMKANGAKRTHRFGLQLEVAEDVAGSLSRTGFSPFPERGKAQTERTQFFSYKMISRNVFRPVRASARFAVFEASDASV